VKKKSNKKRLPKVWASIDEMPIYNWFKIHATNDLVYMFQTPVKGYDKQTKLHLLMQFNLIRDEYLDTFGISHEYRVLLSLKRDLQVYKIQYHLTKNTQFKTLIALCEGKIQMLEENNTQPESPALTKAYVEKFMGFRLNEREVTVKEFYSYIQIMQKQVKPKAVNG
jgi:hypothetical protein